ncbi:MAG: DUF2336 domain-containing protein [Rhodospirillales bacterium]|nr:DUF2336 domain-containing protein [Rhodospirillales bacterium]
MTGDAERAPSLMEQAQDRMVRHRRLVEAALDDVLAGRANHLSERDLALYSGILGKLVGEAEAALAGVLGDSLRDAPAEELPKGPDDALARLAAGEAEAARPILLESGRLADPGLFEAAYRRGLEQRLAGALRRSPSGAPGAATEDDQAGEDAVQGLLEHPQGDIREATKAYLVEEARRLDSYQEPLLRLKDLDRNLAERLAWGVAAALRVHLGEALDIAPDALDGAIESAVKELVADLQGEVSPAVQLAELLDEQEMLTQELPAQVLRQGEVALFEALFGRLSGLAAPRLQRVLYDPDGLLLAIACRALGLGAPEFRRIFGLTRRVHGFQGGGAAPDVTAALARFDAMAPEAARLVFGLWWRDPGYLDALDEIAEGRTP